MVISRMFGYSTRDAAKKLGISFTSINRYIADGKIPLPPLVKVGGVKVRLWSDADIERVRVLLPRIANGRKTRYKKKQLAIGNQHPAKSKSKARSAQPRAAAVQNKKKNSQARAPVVPKSKQHKKK